jgi:hypothetical protein
MNVIVTGATGMVGEGVLHECLLHPGVTGVLVINRKSCDVKHPKLKEILHSNFFDFSSIRPGLTGYDACFFCLGVSSVGMKEDKYYHLTYDLTLHVASVLSEQNPQMVFCYVSGAGTDSSEKGRSMWARVKGKTENDLIKLFPRKAYMFRPGVIKPTPGLKNALSFYKYLGWMIPLLRPVFPKFFISLREIGLAMIQVAKGGYSKQVLEVPDIVALAKSNIAGA